MERLKAKRMEGGAFFILNKAEMLDESSHLEEALTQYQRGICKLEDMLQGLKRDSEKVPCREKLKTYKYRVNLIQEHLNQVNKESKCHQQIKIAEDATGYSYESLLKPYMRETVTEVWVKDHIKIFHQLGCFLRFCEMLLKTCKVKHIHLLTSQNKEDSSQQTSALAEIKQSLKSKQVYLEIQYGFLNDREIRFDNGWVIKLSRGLDYFKKSKGSFSLGHYDFNLRECHESTVDVFHTKHIVRAGTKELSDKVQKRNPDHSVPPSQHEKEQSDPEDESTGFLQTKTEKNRKKKKKLKADLDHLVKTGSDSLGSPAELLEELESWNLNEDEEENPNMVTVKSPKKQNRKADKF